MGNLFTGLGEVLTQNVWLAVLMTLAAGFISSFSPCVLSAVPLIIGYVGGYSGSDKKRAFKYSIVFCAGLSITFTALGAVSALIGRLMSGVGRWWFLFLGVVTMILGLQMLGILDILPQTCKLPDKRKGMLGAFILGIVGGVVSSPCATPALAAILAYVAGKSNLLLGIILLGVYSIGHCTLILIAGTSVGFVQRITSSGRTEKLGVILKRIFGALVIVLSLYLLYIGF